MLPLHQLAFGGVLAEFKSPLSPAEAAAQLAAVIERPSLLAPLKEALVGQVKVSNVRIRHYRPFFAYGVGPEFIGAFLQEGEGSLLKGRFTTHFTMTAFLVLLYAYVPFVAAAIVVAALQGRISWPLAIAYAAFAVMGAAMAYVMGKVAVLESAGISEAIAGAIRLHGA
jgi:uncharacterized integral membrane protein